MPVSWSDLSTMGWQLPWKWKTEPAYRFTKRSAPGFVHGLLHPLHPDPIASPLLLIRQPQRPRRPGVADEAGEEDDGKHVGDDLDELDRDPRDPLHLDRQGVGESEEEAGEHRLHRPPFAEDQGR